jgi:hypothetical protein
MVVHALWVEQPACQTYTQPNTEVQLLWLSRWCISREGLQRIHILPGCEVRIAPKWVSFPTRRIWSDDQNTKLKRSVAHKKCLGLSSKLCMDFIVEFVDKICFWIPFVGVVEGCKLICLNLDAYSFDNSSSTISRIPIVCSRLECAMMIESQTLQVYYFVSFISIAFEHMISAPKKLHEFAI